MATPPVIQGTVQERAIRVAPSALAVSSVGAAERVGPVVVPLATSEAGPVPAELMAETR